MAPSTPKGLSKEPYTGYQVGDDDQLWTPSIDQVHFPDHISVAVPFKIKDEGVSIKLEDSKDITYQEENELKATDDIITNTGQKRKIEAADEVSLGTQDFLIPRQLLKSKELTTVKSLRRVTFTDDRSDLASLARTSILLAENEHHVIRAGAEQPQKKKKRARPEVPMELRRWSRRIAGPAKEFNRYFRRLPLEVQRAIWNYAAAMTYKDRRCVYIRNRALRPSSGVFEDGVLNRMPALWDSCGPARDAMLIDYDLMFARIEPEDAERAPRPDDSMGPSVAHLPNRPMTNNHKGLEQEYDFTNQQLVNPDFDVIILEPCCYGCRANHCVKRQFNDKDRHFKYLAVQTDPANLPATSRNSWASVSLSFKFVEKLYMIVNFDDMPRNSKKRRALIRVKEGFQETRLRDAFNLWKLIPSIKGGGIDSHIEDIIFVAMVELKQPGPRQKNGDQYNFVKNRVGGPHDIIAG